MTTVPPRAAVAVDHLGKRVFRDRACRGAGRRRSIRRPDSPLARRRRIEHRRLSARPRSPENTTRHAGVRQSTMAAPRIWPARQEATLESRGMTGCCLPKAHGAEALRARPRRPPRVERQGRLVLREAVPVGEFGVLLLQMAAVGQQDPAQIARRLGAVGCGPRSRLDQQRQIAGVVEMRVGQDHRVDASRDRPAAAPSSAAAAA